MLSVMPPACSVDTLAQSQFYFIPLPLPHSVSRGRGKNIPLRIGTPVLYCHTSSRHLAPIIHTPILLCSCALEPYLSILMCCLLTYTHTYIGDRRAHTSRSKETCQHCPTTFIKNSLNTESLNTEYL